MGGVSLLVLLGGGGGGVHANAGVVDTPAAPQQYTHTAQEHLVKHPLPLVPPLPGCSVLYCVVWVLLLVLCLYCVVWVLLLVL